MGETGRAHVCRRSWLFIVNLKHVHSVSSGMVMLTDGTELGVTRGYRKELTEKHIAFVQGGM